MAPLASSQIQAPEKKFRQNLYVELNIQTGHCFPLSMLVKEGTGFSLPALLLEPWKSDFTVNIGRRKLEAGFGEENRNSSVLPGYPLLHCSDL